MPDDNVVFAVGGDTGTPLTVLCLGAHSDDIEIGCGGTILRLVESRSVIVHWMVFGADSTRANEASVSANLFLTGAVDRTVVIEDFEDGFFPFHGAAVKARFEQLKAAVSPDLIFTHYRDDRHQDHRLISDLTWNTFRHHLVVEYEVPKYDGDLGQPNFYVRLDEATCLRKVQYLLQSFQSQAGKHWFTDDTFLALLRLRGIEANCPTRYAEAFYCRKFAI
jgi:LmbE family N-acetylglucosaminyl deacetylase